MNPSREARARAAGFTTRIFGEATTARALILEARKEDARRDGKRKKKRQKTIGRSPHRRNSVSVMRAYVTSPMAARQNDFLKDEFGSMHHVLRVNMCVPSLYHISFPNFSYTRSCSLSFFLFVYTSDDCSMCVLERRSVNNGASAVYEATDNKETQPDRRRRSFFVLFLFGVRGPG